MISIIILFNVEVVLAENVIKKTIQTDKVLAIVNGKEIYKSSFGEQYNKFKLDKKKKLLQRVISSEILVQYAEKHVLYKDKALIEKVKKHAKKVKLANKKFTNLDYRMVLGLNVIEKLAKEYAFDKANNPKNIHQYYIKRDQNFKGMPYVDAYSIKSNTKKEAENIIKELNSNKSKDKKKIFIELAKKYQPNKDSHLGKIYKFGIDNNIFNRTLFSLKTNQYNLAPIKFKDSFYILYVALKNTALKAPSEKELTSNIKHILQYKLKNEWINSKLEELQKKSKIINNLE